MMTLKEELNINNKPSFLFYLYEYNFYSFNNNNPNINNDLLSFQHFPITYTSNKSMYGIIINCKIDFSDNKEKFVYIKKHLPKFNYNQVEILITSDVLKQISIILKNNKLLRSINIKKALDCNQISSMNKFMTDYALQMQLNELTDQFVLYQTYNLKLPDDITQRHKMAKVIDMVLETNNDNKIEFYYRSD